MRKAISTLRDLGNNYGQLLTLARACGVAGTTVEEARGDDRHARPAMARALVCALIRETTNLSYPKIAVLLDYDNHTSVIHAVKLIRNRPAVLAAALQRFEAVSKSP